MDGLWCEGKLNGRLAQQFTMLLILFLATLSFLQKHVFHKVPKTQKAKKIRESQHTKDSTKYVKVLLRFA